MENEEEGCTSPTAARRENSMPAARGGNRMPEIPDAMDEIEVLRAAKSNWRRVLCGGRGRRACAVQRGRRGGERRHQAAAVEQGGGNLICWMGTPWDGGGTARNEVVAVPS